MSLYIQAADLKDLPGAADFEVVTVQKLIEKAEVRLTRILSRRGCVIGALIAEHPDRLPVLKDVLENAVMRVLRNPDGASQESEGDYSIGFNALDAAANIWFPAQDLDDICGAAASSTVGSIQTFIPAHRIVTGRRYR